MWKGWMWKVSVVGGCDGWKCWPGGMGVEGECGRVAVKG